MDIKQALELVLELANQNVIDFNDMPEEHMRQIEAINAIEDFVNLMVDIHSESD